MKIYFDIDCGESVSAEDIKQLLDETADFLTSTQNHTVKNVPDQGILDKKLPYLNYTNFWHLLTDFEKEANILIKEDKEINWEPDRTIGWALEESVDTLMEHVADVSDFDWDPEPDGEGGEVPTAAPIEWTREDPNTTKKEED